MSRFDKSGIGLTCDWCGKELKPRCPSKVHKHNFCCRECCQAFSNKKKNPEGYTDLKDYSNMSEHMSRLNRELNPTRMTPETRQKLREAHLNTGEGKSYEKLYGRHAHRVVAEIKLGRPLRPGEIVHHIDGDKRNNDPDNIRVYASQADHARYHAKMQAFFARGGDDQ